MESIVEIILNYSIINVSNIYPIHYECYDCGNSIME